MSYPWYENGFIPSKKGANSDLHPFLAVPFNTAIVNLCALAPVYPLIRGWNIFIAASNITSPSSSQRYYTAFDAAWRTGGGLQMFRGSLSFFASVALVTPLKFISLLHIVDYMNDSPDLSTLGLAAFSTVGQEVAIAYLRYRHLLSSTWGVINPLNSRETTPARLLPAYLPLRYFIPASFLSTFYPFFALKFAELKDNNLHWTARLSLSAVIYTLYELGCRDTLLLHHEIRDSLYSQSNVQKLPLMFRALTWTGGIFSVFVVREIVTLLAGELANKKVLTPF